MILIYLSIYNDYILLSVDLQNYPTKKYKKGCKLLYTYINLCYHICKFIEAQNILVMGLASQETPTKGYFAEINRFSCKAFGWSLR